MKKGMFWIGLLALITGCSNGTESLTETSTTIETSAIAEPPPLKNKLCDITHESPNLPAGDILDLAEKEYGDLFEWADSIGAEVLPLDENRSYALWWTPENFDPETDPVIVSLHGHGEWAIKDFDVWQPAAEERNYALLTVQWWFGRSLEPEGYYEPDQISALIEEALSDQNIPQDHVIFQGFSMASARSYTVTLYDQWCGSNYFGVSIANAGPWEDNYTLHEALLEGTFGTQPFEGTRWILFCGENDINEFAQEGMFTDVCEGMAHTQDTLEAWGGTVDLFIQDPTGDHGSFTVNPANQKEGLDVAVDILEELWTK